MLRLCTGKLIVNLGVSPMLEKSASESRPVEIDLKLAERRREIHIRSTHTTRARPAFDLSDQRISRLVVRRRARELALQRDGASRAYTTTADRRRDGPAETDAITRDNARAFQQPQVNDGLCRRVTEQVESVGGVGGRIECDKDADSPHAALDRDVLRDEGELLR